MNWSNVKLILHREVRDQLRDRRTLFMIAVLPLLLYPLLGMSMFQVLQFVREHPTRVLVIGAGIPAESPALVEGGRFAERWFSTAEKSRLLEVTRGDDDVELMTRFKRGAAEVARPMVEGGEFEAVIYFPPDFAERLAAFRARLAERRPLEGPLPVPAEKGPPRSEPDVPGPEIFYNTAQEKSQITFLRVSQVLDRWRDEIGRENLAQSRLPVSTARPFQWEGHDVAKEAGHRDAAVWSKLLPFLLVIWALTGAFYPAIDLCAGEKERGTLETLLSSPAERSEIVWGKLLTVMAFSAVTAMLNLLSIRVTGQFVISVLPNQIGPPPPLTPLWLALALLPMSALFGALCLALAAFAKSSKEGQYYLMPLMMVTMPLVILPMAPGVELTLGNSLIPVSGVVLLLRTLMEGNYLHALPFVPLVVAVTLACCLWAIRWAVDQFNSENVLFRESERLDVGLWFKHLLRDRGDTPSPAEAILCGVLILLVQFFMNYALGSSQAESTGFRRLAVLAIVTQLVVIATPALLMTTVLTRSPQRTLLLVRPPLGALLAAGGLAVALHPAAVRFSELVQKLYPINEDVAKALSALFGDAPSLWQLLLLVAVVPAICEELAFRGFILSGLRHTGHRWWAIVISSFFFGITHGILQQSIGACVIGLVIGYLAVQSGSLFPCMAFHLTHNALTVIGARLCPKELEYNPLPGWLATVGDDGGYAFTSTAVVLGLLAGGLLLAWFRSLPYAQSPEEALRDALEHQSGPGGPVFQPAAKP